MLSGVGVLDKAARVLGALEEHPRALAELVAATGLSRATAHRLATALEDHGLVRRDPDGRFALGLRLVALGRAAAEALPLREAARPALEALRDATGESVQLYVREGARRVCIESLESPHGLRTIVPLGAALPLDRGSAGRVLAAEPATLRRGWAESVEEREPGVASVSAPVLDRDGLVRAAVSVSGPIPRTSRQPARRYAAAVVDAARRVEREALLRP
ncbi:MAG: IclR family transcriptional regulator [Acidimicrobiales bacterium]|nr:IclR family transcriptional regulator [Acidimicrobiales bacterium]